MAVIILVVVAIVLVVVGLTTSSSSGNQKIKGPVPYSLLPTTAPSGTLPDSATTSTSFGTSASTAGSQGAVLPEILPANAVAVHVPILMYHYVDAFPPPAGRYSSGLTVRTPDFEKEMGYLFGNGYHAVSLSDVYRAMAGLAQLPAKPVALTFDDGGLDDYSVAYPILKRYGFTASFFVITGHVGQSGSMDWDDLREMVNEGMFVGSHTVTHPNLCRVTAARLRSELVDSRTAIDQQLGETDYALCYPTGAYNSRVIEAARSAGYLMALSTNRGKEDDPKAVYEMTRRRVPAFMSLRGFAKLVQ